MNGINTKEPLLVFFEDASNENEAKRIIIGSGISFIELKSFDALLSALSNSSQRIIIFLGGYKLYNKLQAYVKKWKIPNSSFIIFHSNDNISLTAPNNCFNITSLQNYLTNQISPAKNACSPHAPMLIEKLVGRELETLGIDKKYLGFKYLLDLITHTMNDHNLSDEKAYALIGNICNKTNMDPVIVERDIRHMLTTCWKKNMVLQSTLTKFVNGKYPLCNKNLLSTVLLYFKRLF